MTCRHCKRKKSIRARGLCWRCFFQPGVRDRYAAFARQYKRVEPTETEEDLDRLIAHQYANLPDWWHRESVTQPHCPR